MEKTTTNLPAIRKEIEGHLADPEVVKNLVATTFHGLSVENVKQALLEGMGRGFSFESFLKKDVYAIPYAGGYSLVSSIDWARKIGMKNGIIGVSEPSYDFHPETGKVLSCTMTVKRRVGQDIGEFTAKVFFSEYNTGKNLWVSKPLTMIAKVAEMHALRKACPEELAQAYTEEELAKPAAPRHEDVIDLDTLGKKLEFAKSLEDLQIIWANLKPEEKKVMQAKKDEMKAILESETKDAEGQK